jgi:hypothetical protein
MANKVFVWSGSAWEEVITSVSAHAQEHLAGGLDPITVSPAEISSGLSTKGAVLVATGDGGTEFEQNHEIATTWWMS